MFWETIDFVKNLEMTQIARGGWGGGHVFCVIMMQCVRKSICDSSLSKVGSWKSQENRLLKIRNNSENVETVVLRPVLESLFYKVAGLIARNFIKGRLQHRCFPLNIAKFLRAAFLTEHHRWLLARTDNFERFICNRP